MNATYCAVTSGAGLAALPFALADAEKICETATLPPNSTLQYVWSSTLVSIGSDNELAFILDNFPVTNNTVGYWTAVGHFAASFVQFSLITICR